MTIRTADIVLHIPSGEEWVVAWADPKTGYMAPCGWPTCQARIADCQLVETASDAASAALAVVLANSGRTDAHQATQIANRPALTKASSP